MLLFLGIFLSTLPFLWLFTQIKIMGDFTSAFANIAGLLGVVLMMWQLVLGNRFISKKISKDYVEMTKLHTFLGIYGFFFVFAHPFFEMMAYGKDLTFLFVPDFSTELGEHIIFGRIAIYFYLFVWLSSALARNKISYRIWRYLHYLSFPVLFFAFIHAISIGTFLNTFILLKIYFIVLMLIFAVTALYRFAQLLNFSKSSFTLTAKKVNKAGITSYTFSPITVPLVPEVGQFFFIKPGVFAESHPFTVMSFNEKTGELVFAIKAIGQFTNQLEQIEIGQTVFLDGPYGVFTKEAQNNQPKVIIAGGVGITPFIELASRFGDQNTKLFYANRHLEDALNREQFKAQLGANYIDVISGENLNPKLSESIVQGRIDEKVLSQYLAADFIDQANFFICGSPAFMSGILTSLTKLKINKNRIFFEEFSF